MSMMPISSITATFHLTVQTFFSVYSLRFWIFFFFHNSEKRSEFRHRNQTFLLTFPSLPLAVLTFPLCILSLHIHFFPLQKFCQIARKSLNCEIKIIVLFFIILYKLRYKLNQKWQAIRTTCGRSLFARNTMAEA